MAEVGIPIWTRNNDIGRTLIHIQVLPISLVILLSAESLAYVF